jgi:hypothetical protein
MGPKKKKKKKCLVLESWRLLLELEIPFKEV